MLTGFLLTIGFPELLILLVVLVVLFGGGLAGLVLWRAGRKRDGR